MIILDNVSLRIKKVQIPEDISLELGDGQIHGLVGRNGCGKTMLMKCICGFVCPTGGRIQVNGKYVGEETEFPEHLGVTIVLPSHNAEDIRLLCDSVYRLSKGRLL